MLLVVFLQLHGVPTSVDQMYGRDVGLGSGIIPQTLHHDRVGGNNMRTFGDTPDSQERYGDHFGNGSVSKPADESPLGRKLVIDYGHGRQAPEEVHYGHGRQAPEEVHYGHGRQAPEQVHYGHGRQAPEQIHYGHGRQAPKQVVYGHGRQALEQVHYGHGRQAPEQVHYGHGRQAPEEVHYDHGRQAPEEVHYDHGRQAPEGEVQYTSKCENSLERDRGYSENVYGLFQRDKVDGNKQGASFEGQINNRNDWDDVVNRDKIFTKKRKNPFEQESERIKKLKELSKSDSVCQKKSPSLFEQGMEYKPKSDGPVKRDRAYRKRKKIVERDNIYKKECDSFNKKHNFVPEHKENKIKNIAGQVISDDPGKEVENKACFVSQGRLKLYLKELEQLKSLEKNLKGKTDVEEQKINKNKALQEELQKEIDKLRGHQSQINDAIPVPFEKDMKNVKSKDHGKRGISNRQFEENFFPKGQFASKDGTNKFMSDSVMLKRGLAKNETPVMDNEIIVDIKVHTLPVIKHSDIMPCNDIEVNEDIKQIIFDKLTLKPIQSRREFVKLQWQDPSLADIRMKFELGSETVSRGGDKITKFIEKDTLIHKVIEEGDKCSYQLVVPTSLREDVMHLAHESSAEGHLSSRKTLLRIQKEFHWPDVKTDVRMFCRYCMICNSLSKMETKVENSDTNSSEDAEESSCDSEVDQEENVIIKNSIDAKHAKSNNEEMQNESALHDSASEDEILKNSLFSKSSFSLEEFAEAQQNDPKLAPIFRYVESGIESGGMGKKKGTVKFVKEQNLIFRQYTQNDKVYRQLVVPHIYREQLIKMAHESPGTHHLGKKQTKQKMLREFYWRDLGIDVKFVYESCEVCYKKWPNTIIGNNQDLMLYDLEESKTHHELAKKDETIVDLLFSKCSLEELEEALKKDSASENEIFKNSLFSKSSFSLKEFSEAQQNDKRLAPIFRDVESGIERGGTGKKKGTVKFVKKQNFIFRQYTENETVYHQLVAPHIYRKQLIKMAHESPGTHHLGKNQTKLKMLREFYWNDLRIDVKLVYESCEVCYKKPDTDTGLKIQDELAEQDDPLVDLLFSKCSCEEFKEALEKDTDLNDIRLGAESGQDVAIFGISHKFIIKEGLIYRQATHENIITSKKLVVPRSFREEVKEIAHVSQDGSHLSKTQTRKRLRPFYWPGSVYDALSCSTCQMKVPKISRDEEISREEKKRNFMIRASLRESRSSGFPTKSHTKKALQPHKMARGLKFRI